MENESRWVMVSDGTSQMMYAGKTVLSEAAIDTCMAVGRPIELTECRTLRTIIIPGPDGSVGQREMMSPIGTAREGIRVKIKPLAYFWPDESDATNKAFANSVSQAEQAEQIHRAREAGLITPVSIHAKHGGRTPS
jgi:hypothetical protein